MKSIYIAFTVSFCLVLLSIVLLNIENMEYQKQRNQLSDIIRMAYDAKDSTFIKIADEYFANEDISKSHLKNWVYCY